MPQTPATEWPFSTSHLVINVFKRLISSIATWRPSLAACFMFVEIAGAAIIWRAIATCWIYRLLLCFWASVPVLSCSQGAIATCLASRQCILTSQIAIRWAHGCHLNRRHEDIQIHISYHNCMINHYKIISHYASTATFHLSSSLIIRHLHVFFSILFWSITSCSSFRPHRRVVWKMPPQAQTDNTNLARQWI